MNDMDLCNDELLQGELNEILEENTDLITVTNTAKTISVTISPKILLQLYKALKLKVNVMALLITAHEQVLKHGLEFNSECAIGIDIKSGKEITRDVSDLDKKDTVKLVIPSNYKGKLVAIHNHPYNSPFSTRDIHTFGTMRQLHCLSIQGHSGVAYTLIKTKNTYLKGSVDKLSEVFNNMRKEEIYKDKTTIEVGEIFVQAIADKTGWIFLKGGD